MAKRTPPPGWTPDHAHWDPVRETFCLLLSRGENGAAAYRVARGKIVSVQSAKVSAYRLSREEPTAARLSWLRSQQNPSLDEMPPMTALAALEAMSEVVTILDTALLKAEELAVSVNELARLRAAIANSATRAIRMRSASPSAILEPPPPAEAPAIPALEPLPRCSCGHCGEP